jgi:8-amino-7-oxononanoate synthase
MGTLSKALGSYGGYVCGSQKLIDLLVNRARSFVYSTGLPPMSTAAALAALEIIEQDPSLVDKPLAYAKQFCDRVGLPMPQSPIVPVIFGSNDTVMTVSEELADEGFLVSAIRPPTVPENTARLRIAFNACHKSSDIDRLADLVCEAKKEYGVN